MEKAAGFMDFLSKIPERVRVYFTHRAVQYAALFIYLPPG